VRGKEIFDIDFTGGTSVHLMLKEPAESEEVRSIVGNKLRAMKVQYTLTGMSKAPGVTKNTIFKVDSSFPEVSQLQKAIQDAFAADGRLKLATYSLKAGTLRTVTVEQPKPSASVSGGAAKPSSPESERKKAAEKTADQETSRTTPAKETKAAPRRPAPQRATRIRLSHRMLRRPSRRKRRHHRQKPDGARLTTDAHSLLAFADEARLPPAKAEEASDAKSPTKPPTNEPKPPTKALVEKPSAEPADTSRPAKSGDVKSKEEKAAKQPAPEAKAKEAQAAKVSTPSTLIEVLLSFGSPINRDTLRGEIDDAATDLKIILSEVDLLNPAWQGGSNAFNDWTLRIAASKEQTQNLVNYLARKFAATSVWPSASKIGSQVAGRMQQTAIWATVLSWIGIIIYVWIRFQRVAFGVAGVLALVHDVLMTVGFIALSKWLAGAFGFLLVEEFKINLTIIAALLTIIGYSINDTIVIFDRIREIRGKSPISPVILLTSA